MFGCGPGKNAEMEDLAVIQRHARFTIPVSARNLRCASDAIHRGPDTSIYGRFEIPAADVALVVAGMPAGVQFRAYDGYSNVTSHTMTEPWWQPKTLLRKRVADWSVAGYSINLLIGDSGDEEVVTIYFFNFST